MLGLSVALLLLILGQTLLIRKKGGCCSLVCVRSIGAVGMIGKRGGSWALAE